MKPTLNYGTRQRRNPLVIARWLLLCALIGMLMMYAGRVAYPELRRLESRWAISSERRQLYEACLAHRFSPNTVILDEASDVRTPDEKQWQSPPPLPRPEAGTGGRGREPKWYWAASTKAERSPLWELVRIEEKVWTTSIRCANGLRPRLFYTAFGSHDELFVGGLQRPDGKMRLVVVGFDPVQYAEGGLNPFSYDVQRLPSWTRRIAWQWKPALDLTWSVPTDESLQLFAGTPDPTNPSRFRARFQTAGRTGAVVGTLQNDDTLRFEVQ